MPDTAPEVKGNSELYTPIYLVLANCCVARHCAAPERKRSPAITTLTVDIKKAKMKTYQSVCFRVYTKSETTITNILTAAQTLFLSKNYADVTMDDIAQAAGVTKGALYHHFNNKEALYLAMMLADLGEKQSLFRTAVESKGACRERLRRLTQLFLELPREKRDLIKLVRRDINIFKNPTRDRLIRAYQAALPEQVEAIIRDGIRKKELLKADPRLLAWLHVALVEIILTPYAESVFDDHDQVLDFVTTLFFNGIGNA